MKIQTIATTTLIFLAAQAQSVEKHWEWKFPERQVAWDNVQRIGSDRSYPVFVQGELVLVSCEYNGALLALDGTLWQRIDRFKRYDLSMEPRDKLQWVAGNTQDEWIASSGLAGVETIRIPVLMKGGKGDKNDKATRSYTVRMHFAGVEDLNVQLEGKPVATGVTASGSLVKEFKSVSVTGPLDIQLSAAKGSTMINGLELILEE